MHDQSSECHCLLQSVGLGELCRSWLSLVNVPMTPHVPMNPHVHECDCDIHGLQILGINVQPLLAVGGVSGIAIGFGAQSVSANAITGINLVCLQPCCIHQLKSQWSDLCCGHVL